MAKLVFGMNQSLDGYVDHTAFAPDAALFRHFIEEARGQAGSIYGRRMYEIMRYWDEDQPNGMARNTRLHPVVLGQGTPYFAGTRPPLRLTSSDRMAGDVIRLTCVPA